MKKFLLLLVGFILGALAMYYYCCAKSGEKTMEKMAIVRPKGVITPAQAKVLNDNWTNTRKQAVDSAAGRPDNRSSWWSLDDIKNYLSYAESQADTLGYKMDGIRVYLGVYSSNAPEGKADYATMFIVPTGTKSQSKANFNFFNFSAQIGGGDIGGAGALNDAPPGYPPDSGYPQQ